jgi:excisionase family DNA binding protein
MPEMLTAKEMQDLLQVDRSTIYRMAEAGQLPAVKVGKQWRFPGDLVAGWLKDQTSAPAPASQPGISAPGNGNLASMLPMDCVQLIQDAFAELLGVMLVVTGLDGQPITQVSNPCSLYHVLHESGDAMQICQEKWRELGQVPALEPRFMPGLAGLLCARALVRMGNELTGMVIVFGIAPPAWPPSAQDIQALAQKLGVPTEKLRSALDTVHTLTQEEQKRALVTIQRIADILAHISNERISLLDRLANIARLSAL